MECPCIVPYVKLTELRDVVSGGNVALALIIVRQFSVRVELRTLSIALRWQLLLLSLVRRIDSDLTPWLTPSFSGHCWCAHSDKLGSTYFSLFKCALCTVLAAKLYVLSQLRYMYHLNLTMLLDIMCTISSGSKNSW